MCTFWRLLRRAAEAAFECADVLIGAVEQDRVCELKEEVRLQYQRMHQLLEEDLSRTLEALDRAHARYCQDNAAQVLALGEQRHETQKLLSSIHTAFSKAEDLSFMKNTKPVKILTDR